VCHDFSGKRRTWKEERENMEVTVINFDVGTAKLLVSTWQLPIGPRCRFLEDHLLKLTLLPMAPSYIYEGGEGKE